MSSPLTQLPNPSAALSKIPVHDTLGATMVGFAVSCVVFGILSLQSWNYFQTYPGDRPIHKFLVAVIWFLELVDQSVIGHCVYFYTITNYANPLAFLVGDVIWSLIVQLIFGVTVGTIVKCCFAVRVWRFSGHNVWVLIPILILTFGQFGLAILYAIKAFQLRKLAKAVQLTKLATLSLGSGVLTDLVTALALCFYLRKLRTGYKESDSLVNKLVVYTVNTGLLTGAVSLTTVILYNLFPTKFFFMGSYFILSKLYAISYLCMLNSRKIMRGRGTDRAALLDATSPTVQVRGGTFNIINQTIPEFGFKESHIRTLDIGIHQEVTVVSEIDLDYYQHDHPSGGRDTEKMAQLDPQPLRIVTSPAVPRPIYPHPPPQPPRAGWI